MKTRCLRAVTVTLLSVVTLTACENIQTFTGQVEVQIASGAADGSSVLLLINDDYRYPVEDVDGMWGTQMGGLFVVEPFAEWTPDDGYSGRTTIQSDREVYSYWHEEFAYHPSRVWLGAFADSNDNGVPDAGEPWGAFEGNPITHLPRHAPPGDPNFVDIAIDRLWP